MTNSKKVKIAIISHALVNSVAQNRWKRLAEDEAFEVHLLIPKRWIGSWFSEKNTFKGQEVHQGNFHVHPLPTSSVKNWILYFFISLDAKLRKIKPDLIYIIHGESSYLIHFQIYLYKKIFAPKAKIVFFSMNARGVQYQHTQHTIKRFLHKWAWKIIMMNTEAALVHYPGCVDSLRNGNYNKPIYMQTQIGVDENLFSPNRYIRKKYRNNVGLDDKFIIGYTGRLVTDKGTDDLVSVFIKLAKSNNKLGLLLVGNGPLRREIETVVKENNLDNQVVITGQVHQAEVPNYMNAMDIFVLGSKTMPHWIDTFPLVTVQAQAVGLPVIATDSASLPWQLGDTAKIYSEENREELKNAIVYFMENEEIRNQYALKGRIRCHQYFCHTMMTKNFKKIVTQVISGNYIYHKKNEKYTQWKAC